VRGRLTAAALAVVFAVFPAVPVAAAPPEPTLRAGAARMPLRIPPGTPLAGYGSIRRRPIVPDVLGLYPHAFWFKPEEGRRDELAVRALVIYMGETRVTWVAADLIAIDQGFMRRLGERLVASGIRAGTLIVSASHTHSGPGAFLGSALFAVAAVDREDASVREAVLDAMVEAVRRAGTRARDARMAVATVEAPPVTRSRLGKDVDREIVVLKLTTRDGDPVAVLWNYAIHGTMLGPRNLRLSGDVMGVASRALETALGVPALFVNGAVGDVSPRQHGEAEQETTGRALADAVRAAWAATPPEPSGATPLVLRTTRVRLPGPAFSLRHCAARWVPASARVPLGSFLPEDTELVAGALGRLAWVTMPGEPVTALGRAIKDTARQRWKHALVAGLSNDYLGYFVRPDDYGRPGYVTCAAIYGPQLGECLVDASLALLDDLARDAPKLRRTVSTPSPCDFAAGAR
jgi:neutral ceramidase